MKGSFHYTDGEVGLLFKGRNASFASASAINTGNENEVIGRDPESLNQNSDTQFVSRSVEGKVLDTGGMLEQRSIVLKDGIVQTFFTLPPTSSDHPLSKPKTYSTNDVIGSKTGVLYSDGNVAFAPHLICLGPNIIRIPNIQNQRATVNCITASYHWDKLLMRKRGI